MLRAIIGLSEVKGVVGGGQKNETGPYLPLAAGSALLVGGVVVAVFAQVPGVSGSLLTVAALLFGRAVRKPRRRRGPVDPASGGGATSQAGGPRSPNRPAGSASHEGHLLLAMRGNGGAITAAEAAMGTALTVGEADGMLSRLAGEGHLTVRNEEGTLVYALPARSLPKPAERG